MCLKMIFSARSKYHLSDEINIKRDKPNTYIDLYNYNDMENQKNEIKVNNLKYKRKIEFLKIENETLKQNLEIIM